ncbi:S-layer homology domain-containing protein [Paenibacillus nasutitermitis]|uniref:S-layer homology domain-containing protein n=1 Tax=Paenibacillus nasutitermitis TaxID=1652958 RepID=A0A916ZEP3_9BACL|nr:S-layer homology domain-containing protein [Paenibacillus nasutitermitis]GGD91556.1 hypothetical protein GCM10010911_57850 [Paenibacillus nasutitermitis]
MRSYLHKISVVFLLLCLIISIVPALVQTTSAIPGTGPVITDVSIVSNHAGDSTKAMIGDTITLSFTTDEPVTKLGSFKINGSNPDTFTNVGNRYTATHLVDSGDPVTGAPATFQINVKNAAGIFSLTVEATTDGSTVTIIGKQPVITDVSIASNHAGDATKATIGDTITLSFTTDEPVTKLGNFKINGSNPDTFTNVGNRYTATHLVDSGDPVTGAPATFQINVKNAAGIFSLTVEATTDGSTVTIIGKQPVITDVSIASNHAGDATKATIGDTITLSFTADEPVTKLGSFKINGSNPDTFTNVGNRYTATHLVDSGDPVTGVPATFQINVKNAAGIFSLTVEATTDGSSVTIIGEQPVPSPVITSHPSDATVDEGGSTTFSVTASHATSYQWQVNTGLGFTNISDDAPYSGVTTTTLTITGATADLNGYVYQVIASGGVLPEATSNSAILTVNSAPEAPTIVSAVAGDAKVSLTWNLVDGSTSYKIYNSTTPNNFGAAAATVDGSVNSSDVTGLVNGTTYYFVVKAVKGNMESTNSNEVSAIPTTVPTAPTESPSIQEPINTGVIVLVNGKAENLGTATTATVRNQIVTIVTIDQKKLEDKLAAESQGAVITIPVNTKSDAAVGEFNGQLVKYMEQKQAVVEIKTEKATYTMPAQQINIDSLSKQFGENVALQDIKIQIEIAAPLADTMQVVETAAVKGEFTIVVPPLHFTVRAIYGDITKEVSTFNAYVERTIAIPDGVDPNKITTGVVIQEDGTVRHVPTKIVIVDGKYYAKVSSLTNSTYAIVLHSLEFKDVAQHWAKDAVNNMGSRMVIGGIGNDQFNPDQDITRAEFAAIVVRGLGLPLNNGAAAFSDVGTSDWSSSAINTAYSYQLINGFEDGTFRPNDRITREQAMVIIAKAMMITELNAKLSVHAPDLMLRSYTDAADASNWALTSIADVLQAGIVSGRSSTILAPQANITRAEVAAVMERLLQKSGLI